MTNLLPKITHALLSVSDKTGIVEFAAALAQLNITLLSTGGTAKLLTEHGIPVTSVTQFTGFPEMMAGRVKTLHPKIYAGILARPELDQAILTEFNFPEIGLVVVNLYPFAKTVANPNSTPEEAIENIDIGGPTLLRAAAKNYQHTTVIVDPYDYSTVLAQLQTSQQTTHQTRLALATKVFDHTAQYDAAVSRYFHRNDAQNHLPDTLHLQFQKKLELRYGENPHQRAAFYSDSINPIEGSISQATQLQGKPLSYNNIADADAALECVRQFNKPACVIVKHANPCAIALDDTQVAAYERAYHMDATSAFGGIIAFNSPLEAATLETILANQFVEVIIAPKITPEALQVGQQKPNVRLLAVGSLAQKPSLNFELRTVNGGLLLQDRDNQPSPPDIIVATQRAPSEDELADLLFAWQAVRSIKSNAIVYAKNGVTLGIGAGQMSRVFSAKIGALKAHEAGVSLQQAVMASDAFFPFRDSIDEAAALGITAIIQPGGSIRDDEVIQAANEHNIAMIFTHIRHFRH
jgi:phosphoribosylaminoimidazolecarboxamide formyltransferase / IMP cyclohydrolase